MLIKLAQLAFGAVVTILVLIGLALDALGYAEGIEKHLPWLARAMKNRIVLCVLLIFIAGSLTKDFRDVATIAPPPPPVVVKTPAPPPIEIQMVVKPRPTERSDSLRRKTLRLADEIQKYILERAQSPNRPPFAIPDSSDPNPSNERREQIRKYREYEQETMDYYLSHFKDRMIGIIREYNAMGVRTGYLESSASQRLPVVIMPGSVGEATYMDDLYQFRELAYHVDGEGNLIVITP